MAPVDTRYVILHETVLQSWLKDAVTFGSMAGFAWFNHAYLNGAWVFDIFIVLSVTALAVRRVKGKMARHPSLTMDELRDLVNRY